MTESDRFSFTRALLLLAETLGQPVTDLRAEGYFAALRDLRIDQVLYAIDRALRTETYPVLPTPGKLREFAVGTQADEAEAAWLAFSAAVRDVGGYRQPALDEAIHATVDAVYGGWQAACRDLPAPAERLFDDHRRRFLAAYRVQQAQNLPLLPPGVRKLLDDRTHG